MTLTSDYCLVSLGGSSFENSTARNAVKYNEKLLKLKVLDIDKGDSHCRIIRVGQITAYSTKDGAVGGDDDKGGNHACISYAMLVNLSRAFCTGENPRVEISYEDDDGDRIFIGSSEELQYALNSYADEDDMLTLRVQLSTDSIEKEATSDDDDDDDDDIILDNPEEFAAAAGSILQQELEAADTPFSEWMDNLEERLSSKMTQVVQDAEQRLASKLLDLETKMMVQQQHRNQQQQQQQAYNLVEQEDEYVEEVLEEEDEEEEVEEEVVEEEVEEEKKEEVSVKEHIEGDALTLWKGTEQRTCTQDQEEALCLMEEGLVVAIKVSDQKESCISQAETHERVMTAVCQWLPESTDVQSTAPAASKPEIPGRMSIDGWQCEKDTPQRHQMIQNILQWLTTKTHGSRELHCKLLPLAKQLEVSLYCDAPSFSAYIDSSSLMERLHRISLDVALNDPHSMSSLHASTAYTSVRSSAEANDKATVESCAILTMLDELEVLTQESLFTSVLPLLERLDEQQKKCLKALQGQEKNLVNFQDEMQSRACQLEEWHKTVLDSITLQTKSFKQVLTRQTGKTMTRIEGIEAFCCDIQERKDSVKMEKDRLIKLDQDLFQLRVDIGKLLKAMVKRIDGDDHNEDISDSSDAGQGDEEFAEDVSTKVVVPNRHLLPMSTVRGAQQYKQSSSSKWGNRDKEKEKKKSVGFQKDGKDKSDNHGTNTDNKKEKKEENHEKVNMDEKSSRGLAVPFSVSFGKTTCADDWTADLSTTLVDADEVSLVDSLVLYGIKDSDSYGSSLL